MNFSDVARIEIPEGEVAKIEKDGVILWQSNGAWKAVQKEVMRIIRVTGTIGRYNWGSDNWVISKYNYGNYSGLAAENTIPPGPDGSTDMIGQMVTGVISGVNSAKANKFTYNKPWVGIEINSLKIPIFNYYSPIDYDLRIYNGSMTTLYGQVTVSMRYGTATINLNQTAKDYFAEDHPEGVEFILTPYTSSGGNLAIRRMSGYDIGTPVLWFE